MTSRLALLVLLAALDPASVCAQATSTTGSTADAGELEVEARARFQLGQLYYTQARFAEAAAEFEAAYAIHPHPLLLHNIYLARRDLGDVRGAADALTRYLGAASDLSAADRRLLEGRLATMQRQIAALPPEEAPVVPAPIGDAPIEEAPIEDVEGPVEEGTDRSALAAPVRSSGMGIAPGAVTLGVGVAAMIGAAIAGGFAEGVRGERDAMCTLDGGLCPASLDQASYASRFATARDAGWGLLVAGGVTAAIGAVLLGVGASEPSESVSAACDPSGCVGVVTGSF